MDMTGRGQGRKQGSASVLLGLMLIILLTGQPCRAGWQLEPGVPTMEQLRDIDGYAADRIIAVGNAGTILQYDGISWHDVSGITTKTIFGIWWASANTAFAVCDAGIILHFDGSAWTTMNSGTTQRLRDIWGASESCAFAVGENGTILKYNGSIWSQMASPTSLTLQSVWGTSCTDVYAVGGASGTGGSGTGIIIHYDGNQWTAQSASVTPRLQDVFGCTDGAVYAAGEDGALLASSGDSIWQAMASGTAETLRGLWGSSTSNLYAVGDYGTIRRYDGSAWQIEASATSQDLFSIWGLSPHSIYAVGRGGIVLHYEDDATDNSTPACPFVEAVDNPDDLRLLRAARNSRLNTWQGFFLTALFYATAPETARIVKNNALAREKLARLVGHNRSLIESLVRKQPGSIDSFTLQETAALLRVLQDRGSRSLSLILNVVIWALDRGWLPKLLDIEVTGPLDFSR